MNIGIVTTWFERGAAYVSKAYFETLSQEHDVFIYARAGEKYAKGDPKWDQSYVTWGKQVKNGVDTFIDWNDFCSWVEKNHLSIVLFNEQQSWDVIAKIRKKLNIKIGAYVDYYTPKTVPFFALYDFLLCNTKRHFSVFKDHPGAYYIPWGTDLETFQPLEKQHQELVFFHSCGLDTYRKGTDLLVRAFQKVKGDAKLIIHAQAKLDRNDEIFPLIEKDTRIGLIEKEVHAPGLFYLGDVYVYPTRLEGIGLTIAEALASGLPVITTDEAPMNEFVKDGICGKLVKVIERKSRWDNYYWQECACSEEDLTRAMQYYVENASKISEFKKQARRFAEENLDWRKNSQQLLLILKEVVNKKNYFDKQLIGKAAAYDRLRILKAHPLVRPLKLAAKKLGVMKLIKKIV